MFRGDRRDAAKIEAESASAFGDPVRLLRRGHAFIMHQRVHSEKSENHSRRGKRRGELWLVLLVSAALGAYNPPLPLARRKPPKLDRQPKAKSKTARLKGGRYETKARI